MERILLLMRHAKSDWNDHSLDDLHRPLNKRGRHDAPIMGKFIRDTVGSPDQIICSNATRAKETAELVAESSNYKQDLVVEPALYNSNDNQYIESICMVTEEVRNLLIVGHNPTIEQLISSLSSGRPNEVSLRVPTASVACFIVEDRDWNNIELGLCELKWFVNPKMLKKL